MRWKLRHADADVAGAMVVMPLLKKKSPGALRGNRGGKRRAREK